MLIINLTGKPLTPEQQARGLQDLSGDEKEALLEALEFDDTLLEEGELEKRAEFIAELACFNSLGGDECDSPFPDAAMIDHQGDARLREELKKALNSRYIKPLTIEDIEKGEL